MIWTNGQISYNKQLENFKNLHKLIEKKLEQIKSNQTDLQQKTASYKINSERLTLEGNKDDELYSALTEIVLEGLCWVTPKILDKKEAGYVSA